MHSIEELPLRESFAIPYRELLYGADQNGENYVRRPLLATGPRSLMSCKQVADGNERIPLSSAVDNGNGEWLVSTATGGDDRPYGTAVNRDEALALVMKAADLSPDGETDGAFGRVARRYERTLRLRAALVARPDVEAAHEFAPVRQIISADGTATLCRYLYHPGEDEEVFGLFENGKAGPSFLLSGCDNGWAPGPLSGVSSGRFDQDRPLDCVLAMLEQKPDLSGHQRVAILSHFIQALDGLNGWRDATRRFGCPTYRNPFFIQG